MDNLFLIKEVLQHCFDFFFFFVFPWSLLDFPTGNAGASFQVILKPRPITRNYFFQKISSFQHSGTNFIHVHIFGHNQSHYFALQVHSSATLQTDYQ
jgi:hypothetical protein